MAQLGTGSCVSYSVQKCTGMSYLSHKRRDIQTLRRPSWITHSGEHHARGGAACAVRHRFVVAQTRKEATHPKQVCIPLPEVWLLPHTNWLPKQSRVRGLRHVRHKRNCPNSRCPTWRSGLARSMVGTKGPWTCHPNPVGTSVTETPMNTWTNRKLRA